MSTERLAVLTEHVQKTIKKRSEISVEIQLVRSDKAMHLVGKI